MAFAEIHLNKENALLRMISCMAILPENAGPGPYPVLYLLHGLSDDHTAWARRTTIERDLEGWPLIVVMPDGGRGWYTDSSVEPASAFETFIVRDLVGFVDRTFQTRVGRASRAVAGLSMGGYGAVKLALKYPEIFGAAASHSGALVNPETRDGTYEGSELQRIFGESPAGGPNDVFALARNLDPERRPALRFDCGLDDYLLPDNRQFHAHLERMGYVHHYAEFPGGHNWDYWDAHIKETIPWTAERLGLKRVR